MVKPYSIFLGCVVLIFTLIQVGTAQANSEAERMYVTTEDIIADIVFPTIDKRVIQEYGEDAFSWEWKRIMGVTYNDNHTYDITVKIEIPSKNPLHSKEDVVKVRISPSCDSDKLNQ